MDIHVLKAPWALYQEKLSEIRMQVFVEEQKVPIEEELDGLDEQSTHFIALNEIGQHVGCARLIPTGQIGRMAVISTLRESGIGTMLLSAAVAEAQAQGMDKVFLHAQTYAEEFYRKGGFIGLGDRFMDAGIEHTTMEMMLPIAFKSAQTTSSAPPTQPPESGLYSPVSQPRQFDSLIDARSALEEIIRSAQRQVVILNPYLDHEIFAQEEIVESISSLARSAPRTRLRIIVMSSKRMIDRGHPLLELSRRLDDKISLRLLNESITEETSSFVCADESGYWLLPEFETPKGVADPGNAVTTRRFLESFESAWLKTKQDLDLRQLLI